MFFSTGSSSVVVDRWTISRRWETLSWYTVRETKVPYRAPISSSAATNIRAPRPPAIRCPKQEFFFVLFLAICAPYRNIILRRFQGHSSALYRLRPGVPDGAQVLRFKALLQQGDHMLLGGKACYGVLGPVRNGLSVLRDAGEGVALFSSLNLQGKAAGNGQRAQVKGYKALLHALS